MKTNQTKPKKVNKGGLRLTLILLIPVAIILTMIIIKPRELSYNNVSKELENAFGESMVLGVHNMGDGLIMSVVTIDGANRSEKIYSDAVLKTRYFAKEISEYKEGSISEIDITIGLKHNIDGEDIIANIVIEPQKLEGIDWGSINNLDELSKYLKINLQ